MHRWFSLLLLAAALAVGEEGKAQTGSPSTHVVSLAAAKPGALTVSVTSGVTQAIANVANNAVNTFPAPATIVTQWDLDPSLVNVIQLVAYFSVPSQALVGPGMRIPSSRVQGRMPTGTPTTFTPINGTGVGGVGTAGGSLRLFSQLILLGINRKLSRTDNLFLQLDLTGMSLPAGTYSGTLNIRAVVQ